MSNIEESILQVAKQHYVEAKYWSDKSVFSKSETAEAKKHGMTEEQYAREELINSKIRCMAFIELSHFDSGLNEQSTSSLIEIEKSLYVLDRLKS